MQTLHLHSIFNENATILHVLITPQSIFSDNSFSAVTRRQLISTSLS